MALETASYVANLVESNPDGLDQRSTADNHLRLIKAALKRTFPKMDGAVSLSAAQVMYLGDLSASVQLQLNQLRDGSATANNALYANSASVAMLALTANSASYAALAGQAASASFATLAATANSASFATRAATANSASYATLAGTAALANQATLALTANSASYAALAGTAAIASNATNAANASAVGGYAVSTAADASTAAARDGNGYLRAVYYAMTAGINNQAVAELIIGNGDGFFYRAQVAHAGTYIEARNITGRSGTAKNLASGSGPPSLAGSTNGDFFYYY